ncbi:MAG: hypothetical protein A3D34_01505 [Candidatus Staskawiczbacteria bacterium RIFCSPHIGHO2_02_FULL_33_16]|uniref:HTH cro/C1-type domain-containing protein n=1 Tax=Candidatus Staskawiczbacteria bacterium RIFCSPHIGHO2_02_FULL_33_16 TaxID=1802204 RepID=A0A1G2HX74_9BACT|nr:MAG: hypothetical protein A3D34_01505 [Candidatus Staskawiczbacteria bacterium RIFCSPHIGHO2_02_FULL_33_16]
MNKNKLTKAIKQYIESKVSMEKAAELADVSIWKFLDALKDRKISIIYDLEDVKREIEHIVLAKS